MEKENFFFGGHPQLNWQQHTEAAMSEMGSALADHLQHSGDGVGGFVHLNWDQSMDQSSHFGSALSSIVSSPSNPAPPATAADSVVVRELIGRLGSICNSGEISPHSHQFLGGGNNSANTSSYSTPMNSPPKINLSSIMEHHQQQQHAGLTISGSLTPPSAAVHMPPFATDPSFTERAARFTSFTGRNYSGVQPQFPLPDSGKLSRNSSSKSLRVGGGSQVVGPENPMVSLSSTPDDRQEETSVSGHEAIMRGGAGESNARKRKATQRGRGNSTAKDLPKVAEEEDANGKRTRSSETGKDETKPKEEQSSENSNGSSQKQGEDNNSKSPEAPKQDYIHVRARRGQATDSHSLAERVRREKISDRMKFLQDLVPGCDKVTGKAVMLDEIINYVQSLQRQVEFLSMKLATVNPRLDFNVESLLQKEMHQPRGSLPHPIFPVDSPAPSPAFPFAQQLPQGPSLPGLVTNGMENHCPVNPLDATLKSSLGMQLLAFDGGGVAAPQVGTFWEDDLQRFVQMDYSQNQEMPFSSQPFHGQLNMTHMKVEH